MTTPNNEPNNPYSSGSNQNWSQPNSSYQPPQYQAPQYQGQIQQQFGGQPGYGYGYPMGHPEGAQLAQTSMILGILSLFVVGIILGPIAIVKANRAEREFNTSATVGKVTGWIGTIFGVLLLLWFIFVFIAAFAFSVPSGFES